MSDTRNLNPDALDDLYQALRGLLAETEDAVSIGDWVLIHVGFAMSKIDEAEAQATREFLEQLGAAYEEELAELDASTIE